MHPDVNVQDHEVSRRPRDCAGRSPGAHLRDRVAIVTGASSGIGAATACELGSRGATVVLVARRARDLENQADAVRRAGGHAMVIVADLANAAEIEPVVQRTLTAFGRIDVLVNNAGIFWRTPLAASRPEEVVRLVNVNLIAAMLLTRSVLPGMLARRRGAIVSVASLSGRVAMEPVYSAAKYGVRGFSLALRRQLAGSGVSASLVTPGNINTPMTAHVSARMPEPDEVAKTIADLIHHPRREVVVPRKHHAIVWLEQTLPSLADHVHRRRNWSPVPEGAAWTS